MKDFHWILRLAAVVGAAAGCEGGGATGVAAPAFLEALVPVTQAATAGLPASVPPAVRVSDALGRGVAGVPVRFTIAAGGGTVRQEAATDGAGVAVAEWVMGVQAQENALRAAAEGLEPVIFHATARPGRAARLEKAGGDGQTAEVYTPAADSMAVRVTDQFGNGVPRIPVIFMGLDEDESYWVVHSGLQGYARAVLYASLEPGLVRVQASSGGLKPDTFTLRAVAGPPVRMERVQGTRQGALSGRTVPEPPAVRVWDRYDNLAAGQVVRFVPAPGSGEVGGGEAVADSSGVARVQRWTMGNPGVNSLTVHAGSAYPATFTAISLLPCGAAVHALFTMLGNQLFPDRCRIAGQNTEVYTTHVSSPQGFGFILRSEFHGVRLSLLDNEDRVLWSTGGYAATFLKIWGPAGSYRVAVAVSNSEREPAPDFTLQSFPLDFGCDFDRPLMLPGAALTATFERDCESVGIYSHGFELVLRAGERVRVTSESEVLNPYLSVRCENGPTLVDPGGGVGSEARLEFGVSTDTHCHLVTGGRQGAPGPYTLRVVRVDGPAPQQRSRR